MSTSPDVAERLASLVARREALTARGILSRQCGATVLRIRAGVQRDTATRSARAVATAQEVVDADRAASAASLRDDAALADALVSTCTGVNARRKRTPSPATVAGTTAATTDESSAAVDLSAGMVLAPEPAQVAAEPAPVSSPPVAVTVGVLPAPRLPSAAPHAAAGGISRFGQAVACALADEVTEQVARAWLERRARAGPAVAVA